MKNQKYSPISSQNPLKLSISTLGACRNRYSTFTTYRNNQMTSIPIKDKRQEHESSLNENGKTSLLGLLPQIDNKSSNTMVELKDISQTEHFYIDIFNSTNVLYEELKQNFAQLQLEQQMRIMPKFDDEENIAIDKRIKELIIHMTTKVKKCEENIKRLPNIKLSSSNEMRIKENMKINLAEKIKDFTHEFRVNEEKYMRNYKELVGDTNKDKFTEIPLDSSYEQANTSSNNFLQETVDISLKKRDEEITTLLTSINELATIFKDLQVLVQEQGTILDRIDYNIEAALTSTEDAHKSLKKANDNMKQNCFRNATMFLLIVIFILSVLLLLKFTS